MNGLFSNGAFQILEDTVQFLGELQPGIYRVSRSEITTLPRPDDITSIATKAGNLSVGV